VTGTNRVVWDSPNAPSTRFYLNADVVETQAAPAGAGNGRWRVRLYLQAFNLGSTGSFDNGYGEQNGYANGVHRISHTGSPFLPAGYANGAQRWEDGPLDFWVNANSNGYWSGTSTTYGLHMAVACPAFSSGTQVGSIQLPRIAQVPPAPSPIGLDEITGTSMRYRFSGNGDGGSAIIRWEYQRSTTSNFSSGNGPITTSTGTSTATGLANRTKYYFRSRGVNAVGNGPWSSVINATTLDEPDKPTLTLDGKTSTTIDVTVNNGAYTGGTILEWQSQLSKFSDFSSITHTATTDSPNWTASHGVTRYTQFYIRSRIRNSVGWSAYSTTLAVLTDAEAPSTPTGYEAHRIASRTAFSTLGTILDNGGLALTQVNYQYNTSASEAGATDTTLNPIREPIMSSLVPGTTYYYRLRVYNGQLWSAWGAWQSFVSRDDVPYEPTSLAVDTVGDETVTLEWVAPSNLLGSTLLGYRVVIAIDTAQSMGIIQTDVSDVELTAVLIGLTPGTTYYARVFALSDNGEGSVATLLSFATTSSGGSPELVWENVEGVWKQITHWENVEGVWKEIILWENVEGVWKNQ